MDEISKEAVGAMVLVPSEPTPEMVGIFNEMLESVDDGCLTSSKHLLAKLISHIGIEQVPAVHGEPKVLGYVIRELPYSLRHTRAELDKLTVPFEEDQIVELIDRAHLAPMLAKIGSWAIRYRQLQVTHAIERDKLKTRIAELESA